MPGRRSRMSLIASSFSLLVVAGCESNGINAPDLGPVHEIVLSAPAQTLSAGVPTQIQAVAKDSAGNVLPGHAFSWSSSDEAVARVSNSGEVTGVTPGTVTITAATEGKTGALTMTVVVGAPSSIEIIPASPDVFRGSSRQLSATVRDVMGNVIPSITVQWSSSNSSEIPVNPAGLIIGAGPTTAESEITASVNSLTKKVVARIPAVSSIQIGWDHGCLLTDRGRTYCWGENIHGQLGTGIVTRDTSRVPVASSGVPPIAKLSVGQLHSCGLTSDGTAYCWGWNATGQIGDGSIGGDRPAAKQASGTIRFSSISAGQNHTCAIATDGDTYCWGNGNSVPAKVATPVRFTSISAGVDVTCGLDPTGRAWCWGANSRGELGTGSIDSFGVPSPIPVEVAEGLTFKSIDTGSWGFVCGLTTDGAIYCWGALLWRPGGGYGLEKISGNLLFAEMSAGANQVCALTPSRQAWCLGNGFEGQLGDGQRHEPSINTFVAVLPGTPPASGFSSIGAGESATCAISVEGAPYCWGYWSRLGAGVDVRQTSPVLLKSP